MTRRRAAASGLPALLAGAEEEVARDYRRLLRAEPDPEECRLFAARHAALKAALAHLEALRKLGGPAEGAARGAEEAAALLARAREEATGDEDDPTG